MECHHKTFHETEVTSVDMGYCWRISNYNYTVDKAVELCKTWKARLPAVNTHVKADKLTKFISATLAFFKNGTYGDYWKLLYKQGWPAVEEYWVSSIAEHQWSSTKNDISNEGAETYIGEKVKGEHCVLFNYITSKWRLTSCEPTSGEHPVICEETDHVYPDEISIEDVKMPPITQYPTTQPPIGSVATCPSGFSLYQHYCFHIPSVEETAVEAETMCLNLGGNLTWFSEATKAALIRQFMIDRQTTIQSGVWLSRITGNGFFTKWKSSGTSAWYVVHLFGVSKDLTLGPELMLYINHDGMLSYCKENCKRMFPFCEAPVVWIQPSAVNTRQDTASYLRQVDYRDEYLGGTRAEHQAGTGLQQQLEFKDEYP